MAVLVDKNTKIMVQGITGTQASFHIQRAIKYGTNIVAGVVPNKKEDSAYSFLEFLCKKSKSYSIPDGWGRRELKEDL